MKQYLLRLLVSLDQVGTTLVGGYPDETMSSYAYRLAKQGKPWGKFWRPVIDAVAAQWPFRQTNHCESAYQEARARVYSPPELRGLPVTGETKS